MSLPNPSVVILSSPACVPHFRNALISNGVTAHVFNTYAAALTLLRRKKIDTVVVQFARDAATVDFCETVRSLDVPVVYA